MIGYFPTFLNTGSVGNQSLDQVLAIGDRPIKEILTEDDYNADYNNYVYDLQLGDTTKALFVGSDGIHFGADSKINLTSDFPENAEAIIYNTRSYLKIAAIFGSIANPNTGDESYIIPGGETIIKVKRIDTKFFVNVIDSPLFFNPENINNKATVIDPTNTHVNSNLYPSIQSLIDYLGITSLGLSPIIFYDGYGEGFTELNSGLDYISNFNFPAPPVSYYDYNSKKLYVWYDPIVLGTIEITANVVTEDPFCFSNSIVVQDTSGFIINIDSLAFANNGGSNISIPHIFKTLVINGDSVFSNCQCDFIIETVYADGSNFAFGAGGNIQINEGHFSGDSSFVGYSAQNGKKVIINNLLGIGSHFFTGWSLSRVDIFHIDNSVFFDAHSFSTTDIVSLHVPAIDVMNHSNFTQLQSNITNEYSVLIRE